MYIEEIVSRRKGKEYKTVLVRESYREGSSVNHRTIANVSYLPQGCIEEIKRYLKGCSGTLDFSQVQVIDSKEYGASQSAISFARKLGLDKLISSRKFQWRENILAMIVGKLLYPGNELFLTTLFSHTVLWESCGHPSHIQPDVYKNYFDSLNQLLSRKQIIQKKLKKIHLAKESISLLFLITTAVEEEVEYEDFTNLSCDNYRAKIFTTAILTDFNGCPVAAEAFFTFNSSETEKYQQIKTFITKKKLQNIVLVGNQNKFTTTLYDEFKTVTALTPVQINAIIEEALIPSDFFLNSQIYELFYPLDTSFRCIFFVNQERKKILTAERSEIIKQIEKKLVAIQKENQNLIEEIKKIWRSLGNEEFFDWGIEEGKLYFSINLSKIRKKERLDGCCMISTNIEKKKLGAEEVIDAFRKLNQVQQFFRVIKTITTKSCSISLENRIHSHITLCMLSCYLGWHINKKLEAAFKLNDTAKVKQWTLSEAFERLKSIKTHTIRIGDITISMVKTASDEEQQAIISALGVTLLAKFLR